MLKKECCIKCWNRAEIEYNKWYGIRWNGNDEDYWNKKGKVECPSIFTAEKEINTRRITDNPPEGCPFVLEHIL